MEVMKVLDEMEELIESSGRIPLTGKVVLEADSLLEAVDKIRSLLPEDLRQAQWISKERDRIINEAQKEAEDMVTKTHDHVRSLAQETEIVKEANIQAAGILQHAQQQGFEIETGANDYAYDVLKSLEDYLSKMINIVHKGQDELKLEDKLEDTNPPAEDSQS